MHVCTIYSRSQSTLISLPVRYQWPQMPKQLQEQPPVQQLLEQPSRLPLRRCSFEPPRVAHAVCVRVAACLCATTPSTTFVIDLGLAAPASRRSVAA